jgi:hypothetical protein
MEGYVGEANLGLYQHLADVAEEREEDSIPILKKIEKGLASHEGTLTGFERLSGIRVGCPLQESFFPTDLSGTHNPQDLLPPVIIPSGKFHAT